MGVVSNESRGARVIADAAAVGIDIGGTKTHGVALSPHGAVLAEHIVPTRRGLDGVMNTTAEVYARLRDALAGRPIESVGVGVPGVVDERGYVAHAVNLGLDGGDLQAALTRVLEVPTAVENDVNVAALGASLLPGATDSLALLNLGTGLAVGVVIDGEIYRGRHGAAGEIGHLPVDRDGELCVCGQRGCLELEVSGAALRRLAVAQGLHSAEDLFARVADGVPEAVTATSGFVSRLAWAVQLIAVTLDVETIVLGGGVSALGSTVTDPLAAHLRRESERSPFLASLRLASRVVTLPPGTRVAPAGAAAYGAASLARRNHG